MRALSLAAASFVLGPALLLASAPVAMAGNLTAGVGLGLTQDKVDSQGDSTSAYDLFGRLRLGSRLSGQLELGKVDSAATPKFYTATALLVMDLTDPARGALVPTLLFGIGLDHQGADPYSSDLNGQHAEAGVGLEYRAPGGLVLGIDARIGARQVDQTYYATPYMDSAAAGSPPPFAPCAPDWCDGGYPPYRSTSMNAGEYRSVRLTLAVHFQ